MGPGRRRTTSSPRSAAGAAPEDGTERLQKTLARAGWGSRRLVESLIREGRVTVNGEAAVLGRRVDPAVDRIRVDGAVVASHPGLRYFALNKPPGVTSTLRDAHARRTLSEFLPRGPRLFPVGRLDRESEGLLLLTNDGELAHRLQHPRFGTEKEYLVEVEGVPTRRALGELVQGVELEDGTARATAVKEIQRAAGRSALSVVMGEGRKREVRRMFEAIGHPVLTLVRVRMGPVRLEGLRPGAVRELTRQEVGALYREAELDRASPDRPGRRRDRPAPAADPDPEGTP